MKRYGLPTFPINDGMPLGEDRCAAPDELEWLLDHGTLQTDVADETGRPHLFQAYIVVKEAEQDYRLFHLDQLRPHREERTLLTQADQLDTLVEAFPTHRILVPLSQWRWYGN